jgi:hypothetical protein
MSPVADAVVRALLGKYDYQDWPKWQQIALPIAEDCIAAYERSVSVTRLEELLEERHGEVVPTHPLEVRAESRPCRNPECGCPIQPGQLYVVTQAGPTHVSCGPLGARVQGS